MLQTDFDLLTPTCLSSISLPGIWIGFVRSCFHTEDLKKYSELNRSSKLHNGSVLECLAVMKMTSQVSRSSKKITLRFLRVCVDNYTLFPFISDMSLLVTSEDTCPKWSVNTGQDLINEWGAVYLPPIAERVNNILKPAIELTSDDVHGALFACAYEYSAFRNSTWCEVFEDSEILDFEYELDLLMRGTFGYGLPGDMGAVLGSLFVNNLVDR